MGCDIHAFIEYADFVDKNGDISWSCFGGRYNPGRDYTMFGVLAGVRDDRFQLFEPRGLPDGKRSYEVEDYMTIWISDEHAGGDGDSKTVTLATAQKWVDQGEQFVFNKDGKPWRVTDPDLHSQSWLTLDEFRHALNYYTLGEKAAEIDVDPNDQQVVMQAVVALHGGGRQYDVGWGAMLAAMEYFEAQGHQSRLIFCFDN